MAVSAIDTPVKVEISKNGAKGANGTNGTDGSGFNNVRKSLIDNPLCWLYKKNDLANTLNQLLNVNRGVTGNYTDIYGRAQVAAILPVELLPMVSRFPEVAGIDIIACSSTPSR